MLGGIDPIIIFEFSRLANVPTVTGFVQGDSQTSRIPVISQVPTLVPLPPIPLYLSEQFTGVYIDSEDKNVDISTDTETLSSGGAPDVNQKGIGNTVSINLLAKKDSLGIALLSSMIDLVFEKVTSKEYAITYLHGATTIFRGVLHSYSANQNSENDLLRINIQLTRGNKNPTKPSPIGAVPGSTGALPGG